MRVKGVFYADNAQAYRMTERNDQGKAMPEAGPQWLVALEGGELYSAQKEYVSGICETRDCVLDWT